MRKIKLYIATSLNGRIAKNDGGVEWLDSIPDSEGIDYGYNEFYESIDTTIMGFTTYQQVIDWGIEFPYKGKKNYVITNKEDLENTEDVRFVKQNHGAFIRGLKSQQGKDIWLVGGGTINTLLWNEGLIDELIIFVMPIVLSEGIELFGGIPNQEFLKLKDVKNYKNGSIMMSYTVN